jgi:predicted acyl esterase
MLMVAGLMTVSMGPAVAAPGTPPAAPSGGLGSWQAEQTYQTAIDTLTAVSCSSTSVCTAVGSTAGSGSGAIVNSTDGGAEWTAPNLPMGVGRLAAISCASTSVCEALGYSSVSGAAVAVGTTNGGATWQRQTLPSSLVNVKQLSCPSTSECVAVGQASGGTAMIMTTTDGGTAWATQIAPSGLLVLSSVACPSVTMCTAVGESPSLAAAIVTTTDSGTTWQTRTAPPIGALTAVSCPSSTVCTAVGTAAPRTERPALVSTTDGDTTWTSDQVPTGLFGPGGSLSDIACASSAACTAVGQVTRNGPGVVIATGNGGSTWATESTPTTFDGAGNGVSCPALGACTAVGETDAGHGIIIGQSPITAVLIPSAGASLSGASQVLDATAASPVGMASVTFEVSGGTLSDHVVSASRPTLFGWLSRWDTTTVPNGTYMLQSVATDAEARTIISAPLTVTVENAPPTTTLQGNGSVEEAWLTGARPGDQFTLLRHGESVSNPANPGVSDSLGSLIIRDLQPGAGYSWFDDTTGQRTPQFAVLAPGVNPPTDSSLYTDQPMHEGLNYITMRDGVSLAATVRYPFGETCSAASPCPTVMEYSGYNNAAPTDPIPALIASTLGVPCTNCGDPNLLPDSATDVGNVLARFSGFATVSLQMRGTGCSGGAFDLFGYPSDYDAYDAIEIVAQQSWVANHKVGLVGISFSGLSQFPAAGTDPPGLAAITPMSPTDDLFSTGYPGGIFNDGFAADWINSRIDDAKAAAAYSDGKVVVSSTTPIPNVAQPWTYYEIDAELAASNGASSTCLANQALHNQSQDLAGLVGPQLVAPGTGLDRDPSLFDRRSMVDWAAHVKVPVFVSGALQDEQTGPQWPALIDAIPKTTPKFGNMVNGDHIDSLDPQTMSRWLEFLDLYVAGKVPSQPDAIDAFLLDKFAALAAPVSAEAPLPPVRFTNAPDVATARSQFAAQTPIVRVLFDNGAGASGPGDMESTYSADFSSWPPTGTTTRLFFGPGGSLTPQPHHARGSTTFTLNPDARPRTSLPPGGNVWAADPGWDWAPVPPGDGIAFQTAPFVVPTTIVGPATIDLWVKAAAPVEDFQATITEVRPQAGQEEYITSGFLRSTNQVDAANSTPLFTDPTYLPADARDLSAHRYALVKIPIDPIVHTFRPGTALRVVVSAPGGDRPVWTFATLDNGQEATVGLGGKAASALTINIVRGVDATATLPVCGTLRGEPCRAYVAEGNQVGP